MPKKLEMSATMTSALGEMIDRGGKLIRYQGGYWSTESAERHLGIPVWHIGDNTMNALVKRGRAKFTEWQDGRNGPFPITAVVVQEGEAADHILDPKAMHQLVGELGEIETALNTLSAGFFADQQSELSTAMAGEAGQISARVKTVKDALASIAAHLPAENGVAGAN